MSKLNKTTKASLLILFLLLCNYAVLAQPLSGAYTIAGVSPDYTTLSAAITDLNSKGVNGAVVFNIRDGNHSGTSWQGVIGNVTGASATNTITFQSQSGNRANCSLSAVGTSSVNYIIKLNGAKYITVKDLTLNNTHSTYGCDILFEGAASYNTIENCVLTGHAGSSTSTNKSRVYATALTSGVSNVFRGNLIDRGAYGIYFRGSSSTSTSSGHVFEDNTFDENHNYAIYCQYLEDMKFNNNTVKRTGTGTYYGCYFYYTRNNIEVDGNDIEINKSGTTYGIRFMYSNYSSNNTSASVRFTNNNINIISTTGTVYAVDTRYGRYSYVANNTIVNNSASTSGNLYNYLLYYNYNSRAENNTITSNKAGGYVRNYLCYYGSTDTFENNEINVDGNPYIYNYAQYYTQNYYVVNNNISLKSISNTIYGTYVYGNSGIFANNKVFHESNTGTVYGLYMDYANGAKIYNNIVATKTNGTNYSIRAYYVYAATEFYNNTVYTEGTSSSNYNLYLYNSSATYGMKIHNNIFYKTGSSGYNCYYYRDFNLESDYNLYYKPSGGMFNMATPSAAATDLYSWRDAQGLEKNSLMYQVKFNNPVNRDFTIDISDPSAWAVNGRGIHIDGDTLDFNGSPRPEAPADGVPDLGAYEIAPNSIPSNADAFPVNPVANSTQVFIFGQDTVATIDWGANVPATYTMRQYTGVQAAPIAAGVNRMYFYAAGTPATWGHTHKPHVYYKNPWVGTIPGEEEAVIASSSNAGAWEGHNYSNASTDTLRNILAPTNMFDSVGSYTGVQNGRIGVRCVDNPKGITITNITATNADIEWEPVFNPIGYQVLVKKNKTAPSAADWLNATFPTTNGVAIGGLEEDSVYYVFVRSICGIGDTSGYSVDSFKTLITCHTPVVKVSDINNNRAVVYWDTIRTATKYDYALTTSPTPPVGGSATLFKNSVLISFLDPDKEYYVHVRANCNSIYNKSDWATVSFKTWPTSVGNISSSEQLLTIHPNPVSDRVVVTIAATINDAGILTVMDMTGKRLKSHPVKGNKTSIHVSELPAGMYILQYSNDAHREQIKFTKQ